MNPFDFDAIEIGYERLSLDVPQADVELLHQIAAYRNALAAVQGKKVRRKWTRKSISEHLLALQCEIARQKFSELVADLGPLPDSDDAVAMEQYARRAAERQQQGEPRKP